MDEGHRFPVIDPQRQGVEEVFVDSDQFGEGPLTAVITLVVAPDPVARGESPDGRPNGLDDPGHVPPHDKGEGQVLRQLATANQGVHRIDANRGGLDERVRRADRRGGPFAELDVLRQADAVDVGGFHGSNPLRPKEPEALCEYPLRRPPLVPPRPKESTCKEGEVNGPSPGTPGRVAFSRGILPRGSTRPSQRSGPAAGGRAPPGRWPSRTPAPAAPRRPAAGPAGPPGLPG